MISIRDFSEEIVRKRFREGIKHIETVDEYLARGGKIKIIRPKIKIWRNFIVNPRNGIKRMRLSNKRTSDKQTAESVQLNRAFFKLHYLHGKS